MINVENDLLSVLSKGGNKFSKGQRIIAKYILSNYDKAAFMTAGRLGKIVGVSESTVVRFAAELGYDGYPSMRKALQEMIRNRLTSVQRIEVAKSMIDDNDIVRSIIGSDIQNLQATLEILEQDSFNKFVDSIIEAKNIYIVGMRTSTSLSSFLGLYLNLLRSNVSVIHDTAASEVFEQIIRIGEGDLFIAISFPRYSSHTVDAMEFAKKMGAMTAAITDGPASPLNGIADVCLHAKSDMVSFLDSLVAPMSLINAIIIAVGIKNKENLSKTFERLETVWSENKVYEQTQHGGTT
ncbi:MAG: MurR/RpiR family transcriptional regulator [Oscillospiraceae bacterium]|nr:MurR/RpiR family transcriptional regulator [Oscillospiraceae bacterium]